jgi:hypothetical protein
LWDAKGNLILGTGIGWDAAYQEPNKKEDWLLIQAAPDLVDLLKDFHSWYVNSDINEYVSVDLEELSARVFRKLQELKVYK